MEWTITVHTTDGDTEYSIPFECNQKVYYVHKKKWWKPRSKWVVSVCRVVGVWATNTYGVTLHDEEHIFDNHLDCSEFKYLFTNKEDAIEFCIKKNAHAKVKVYGE